MKAAGFRELPVQGDRCAMHHRALPHLLFVLLLQMPIISVAIADAASDFYQGRTVTLYIGAEPGGGFDLYARALGRVMGRHVAGNSAILATNMPGAGSMILGNYLAKVAPRDGSAIGVVNPLLLSEPLFEGSQSMAQFRGPDMTMIGNGATAHWALLARHSAGIDSIDDLKRKDLIVGTTARTGAAYILTHAIKKVLGLNHLKIVTGYSGIREVVGAVERGEISGCAMDLEDVMAMKPHWLAGEDIDVVALLSPPNLMGSPIRAPSIMDFPMSEEDKQVLNVIFASTLLSRPVIAPPEIPTARVRSLRDGFLATLNDPQFQIEAERMKITLSPTSGQRMEDMIRATYALPLKILAKVRAVLSD